MNQAKQLDVIIVGAGAAGLMCGIEAAQRGRSVLIVDHNEKPAEKIRISGGGRCNFTNLNCTVKNMLSENPKFAISALKRFTPQMFLDRLTAAKIDYVEKEAGQLFCADRAQVLIDLLLQSFAASGGQLRTAVTIEDIAESQGGFRLQCADSRGEIDILSAQSVVIASGGKSIPKMGASSFGYDVAMQFGLRVVETSPGLVPLTFDPVFKAQHAALVGVALPAKVSCGGMRFEEAVLFTHRGLSGPAILQISSFWSPGDALDLDLLPAFDLSAHLKEMRQSNGKKSVSSILAHLMPQKLAQNICQNVGMKDLRTGDLSDAKIDLLTARVKKWRVKPTDSEGYRTAEVTLGGVATDELQAKTMESKKVQGLYFIGEVVDMTGWLGGHNFQWAWSSGWVAGQVC